MSCSQYTRMGSTPLGNQAMTVTMTTHMLINMIPEVTTYKEEEEEEEEM